LSASGADPLVALCAPCHTMIPSRLSALAIGLSLVWLSGAAPAAEPPSWVVPAPGMLQESYFSNLADGAAITTPFLLKFGLVGRGLAPIGRPVAVTGHHHLLVNRALPLNFKAPLPFNDQYIHFGKGQMETVLNFKPGRYTLRLVMADDKHIPNFVYSKPITITVTAHDKALDPTSLVVPGVAILAPGEGDSVRRPFRLALHACGLNVSNTALGGAGRGHFRVRLGTQGGREETAELTGGQTEVWWQPPPGRYVARMEFVENLPTGKVLASAVPVSFVVE
jgi:hypothetical protein